MKRFRTPLVLGLLLGVPLSGCFGKFALTRIVYKFNGSIEDKFLRSIVTWIIGPIIPVYGLATLADFVIFNTIEFWTGSNPVDSGRIGSATEGDATMTASRATVDGAEALVFEAEQAGKPTGRVVVTRLGDDAVETKTYAADGTLARTERVPMRDVSAERHAELELAR